MLLKLITFGILICIPVVCPSGVHAKAGVSIGTGKIIMDDILQPGFTYTLPSIVVHNRGDAAGEYEMEVTYNEYQSQRKPLAAWIEFVPQKFVLEAGESQQISINIHLPQNAHSGEYYAYLETHTIRQASAESVGATISAAAAAKFHFNVKAAPEKLPEPAKTQSHPERLNEPDFMTGSPFFIINKTTPVYVGLIKSS